MPRQDAHGELASARLDIPDTTRRPRSARQRDLRTLEASIRAADNGALVVTMRTEPPMSSYTLPVLACLQFVRRFEDAVAEALTYVDSGTV